MRKIGIFDDIVAPLKGLINDIQKPVDAVESIFGEIVQVTEQFIQQIMSMIESMRNLFNAQGVEVIFLYPFKDAALSALSSIDKLYQLMISVGAPIIEGTESTIMDPIDAVYASMRTAASAVLVTVSNIVTQIKDDFESMGHVIQGDFARLKALIDSMPVEIRILGRKIREELQVIGEDAFSVAMEVPDMSAKTGNLAFSSVRKVGTVVEADFTSLEASLKRRFANENAALDLLYLVIICGIIAVIVGVFMITHSIRVVFVTLIVLIVCLLFYAIIEKVIGEV